MTIYYWFEKSFFNSLKQNIRCWPDYISTIYPSGSNKGNSAVSFNFCKAALLRTTFSPLLEGSKQLLSNTLFGRHLDIRWVISVRKIPTIMASKSCFLRAGSEIFRFFPSFHSKFIYYSVQKPVYFHWDHTSRFFLHQILRLNCLEPHYAIKHVDNASETS